MNVNELFRGARILSSDNQQKMTQQTNINIQYPKIPDYPINEREVQLEDIQDEETKENTTIEEKNEQIALLQLLLTVYKENPLIINKYVICDKNKLQKIVKMISKADECNITIDEDSVSTCVCGKNKYAKIANIFVVKDGSSLDFKYQYNQQYNYLKSNNISLHFVC